MKRTLSAVVPEQEEIKRHNLTLHDKIVILDYAKDHPTESQTDIASHFRKNGFPALTQSSVSRFLASEQQLRTQAAQKGNLSFKRPRKTEYPDVEQSLVTWLVQAQAKGVKISGDVLRTKARRYAQLHGVDSEEFLSLSNGWLERFKLRYSLKEWRFHGEAGSVDTDQLEAAQKRLLAITDEFAPDDIFNMDETGLNDRMPPDRGLASENRAGVTTDKHRITLAFTVNSTGTEQLPPLFIGHAWKPRCFLKKTGPQLGFNYHANKKAWMTSTIFQKYLEALDLQMRRAGRKILLLLDNAPSHIYDASTIHNIRVEFFPPKMTSRIQPLDAGIIRAFKAHYKRLFCERAVDLEELGETDIYSVNLLEAMRLCLQAWECVTSKTIANCWRHVQIITPRGPDGKPLNTPFERFPAPEDSVQDEDLEAATSCLGELLHNMVETGIIARNRVMAIEELLNPEEEEETEKEWDDLDILEQTLSDIRISAGHNEGFTEDDVVAETGSRWTEQEALEAITELAHMFKGRVGKEYEAALGLFPRLSRALKYDQAQKKSQITLDKYFR